MYVRVHDFWLPKAGNAVSEYEDAYWFPKCNCNGNDFRLAIADGATETSFAGIWANLLVRSFGRGRPSIETLPKVISRCRTIWQQRVGSKPLPWYAEEKVRQGAFASLLGLRLDARASCPAGTWRALAVGDSCLFHTRDNRMLRAFPLDSSDAFNSRPGLIQSTKPEGFVNEIRPVPASGTWQAGDIFYLMTDALACWFLKRLELDADPIGLLKGLRRQQDFEEFVLTQRTPELSEHPTMKNDDVTMLMCILS